MFRKVYLEITNICNLKCSFCPGTNRKAEFLKPESFAILAEKIRPFSDYLYFHLMGEPLLHPQLGELLEIAKGLSFKVIITTNGTLLANRANYLLESDAVHKVNISLQSFEANESNNLKNYISGCAQFALTASQKGKIAVLRLWNNNGLDSLNPDIIDILKEFFPDDWIEGRKGVKLADKVWLESGDKFDWPELTADDGGSERFCYGLRDQIGVLCDGTVVPCCLDHNGDIALGNLFTEELDYIINSPRAKAIYNGFSKREAVEELCRKCGYSKRFS